MAILLILWIDKRPICATVKFDNQQITCHQLRLQVQIMNIANSVGLLERYLLNETKLLMPCQANVLSDGGHSFLAPTC